MPKGAGFNEVTSEDTSLLTDEAKEITRRNGLANGIRKVFFGAELYEIQELLEQYKADMDREAKRMGKKLNEDDKETYQKFIDRQANIYKATNEMLDTLQRNKTLTQEQLTDFYGKTDYLYLDRGDVPTGEAEKQLTGLLHDVHNAASHQQLAEQEKRLDISFKDRVMMPQWHEKLQEFFQKKDKDIYNTRAREKYEGGARPSNLAINLNDRVGEAVTAIYKGELNLPGLEIGNYVQDETAPQKTAAQLVNSVGAFAFLNYGARASFLTSKTEEGYVDTKNSNKENENIYGATLDDILLNGNVKALETLKEEQPKMLREPEGALKEIDDLERKFDSNQLEFKELKTLRENTNDLPEDVWESTSSGETEEAKEQLAEAEKTAKEDLYSNYSKEWLQERFNDDVGSYWDDAMWPGTDHLKEKDLKGWTRDENKTAMEKTIAAHLCSAHDAYREKRLYDHEKKEFNWEKTKDVLTLDHEPAQPINTNSIRETVNYFMEMCAGKKNATEVLGEVDFDNIRLYYDSATLNRQAKVYEKMFRDANPDRPDKDIKMNAYLEAMKRKFDPSEPGAMLSRVEGADNREKWSNYVSAMLEINPEFRKAVHDKFKLGNSEPSKDDMRRDFINAYGKNDKSTKTEIPDFESYEAKLAKREKQGLPEMPDLSEKFREEIESSKNYQEKTKKLEEKYKKKLETITTGNALVYPEHYNENNKQSDVLAKAKEKADENSDKLMAQQEQESKELTEKFAGYHKTAWPDNPNNTRLNTLDGLLTVIGDSPDPTAARENIMNNTKKLKRGWLNVLTLQHRNKAASKFRNMLEDIAARPDGGATMSPKEMLDLYNAAEKVKFSLDQGKEVAFKRKPKDKVAQGKKVLDKEIDINRYELATKVSNAMKEKLRTEGLLAPEKTKEQPSEKKPSASSPKL